MEERGWFWIEGAEENRVRGVFSAEAGHEPQVTLEDNVIDDPREDVKHAAGETTIAISLEPAKVVEAFAPIVLHGDLDSSEPVTLLRAQNHGGPGPFSEPHYVAPIAVIGAHVSDDQLYSAVRFGLNTSAWTYFLPDGAAHPVPDDGSTLRAESAAGGTWLVYEAAQPLSHRELDKRVLAGCRELAKLALEMKAGIQAAEVREDGANDWHRLHNAAWSAPAIKNVRPLLPREEVTVQRFANWIALNERLDGLAAAVNEPLDAAVQAQVLVVTSLVEGLHRRLDSYQQSRFPEATRAAVRRVGKAARDGAKAKAEQEEGIDPEVASQAVIDAVGPLGDVRFRNRAQDIVSEVTRAVPELDESIPDLPGKLTRSRNDIAHHLVLDEEKEPFADRIDRWIVVHLATPWLLRLLLLLRVGVAPDVLHEACLKDQRFGLYRENVASIALDLGWLPRSTEP